MAQHRASVMKQDGTAEHLPLRATSPMGAQTEAMGMRDSDWARMQVEMKVGNAWRPVGVARTFKGGK